MRLPSIMLLGTLGASALAGLSGAEVSGEIARLPSQTGCGNTTPDDSADFLERFQYTVSGPIENLRTHSGLPNVPADSVRYGGTNAQCDTVSARYNALRSKESGLDWNSSPVLMLRVGPNRWVADPKVEDQHRQREWIILDSTFTIVKIFRTTNG